MIIQRILQIIEYKGISKRKFYKKTGLSNGFLDKQKDLGVSKAGNILHSYPEINPLWLFIGEGEMLLKDQRLPTQKIISGDNNHAQIGDYNKSTINSNNSNTTEIEYLKKEVESLNKEINSLNKVIESKEEIIQLLKR